MITKLRKAQDSWVAKAILTLTALSFMSLFGISGYINSTAGNRTVIKVNDRKINQAEINQQLDKEVRLAQNLFGDVEITDEIRNAMLAGLVQRNLNNMIVEETAAKNKVIISDSLIRSLIVNQTQFTDDNGKFNRERFRYFLSTSNISEQQYIENIRLDLKKKYLVQDPVSGFNVPSVLKKYAAAAEAQRKVFKYIQLDDEDIKIDRDISEDEINQYYEDLSGEFVEPERRDVNFLILSMDDITKHTPVSNEEIDLYYQNNLDQFITPETRNVLQMVFSTKEDADKAKAELDKGENFFDVAKKEAHQTNEETNLEYVSKDMLIGETGDAVFAAKNNEVVGPMQSELGWHIMKVTDIKAAIKPDEAKIKKSIAETIAKEKSYEAASDLINKIDDEIGAGKSLNDIATSMGVEIYSVKGMNDSGNAKKLPQAYAEILKNSDFRDAAFSYNKGEISQAIETDEGFVFIKVDAIEDSHPQDIKTALPKIKKIWAENEKSAVAQEIINDVTTDIENGDDINEVASRYKLKLTTTAPLARSETFAGLNQQQMLELFNDALNTPKVFNQDNVNIISIAASDAPAKVLSDDEMNVIERRLSLDLTQQAAANLIDSYGKDFDVRVKYRLLGLVD